MTPKHPKFLNKLKNKPLLPLFFNKDLAVCHNIVKACLANGLEVIEFVDRGASSKKTFSIIKKNLETDGDIQFGVGSIKTVEDAKEFIDLGADFIVSAMVMNRLNVSEGTTIIFNEYRDEIYNTILEKGEGVFQEDRKLWHYVTGIKSRGNYLGIRDILGLDIILK